MERHRRLGMESLAPRLLLSGATCTSLEVSCDDWRQGASVGPIAAPALDDRALTNIETTQTAAASTPHPGDSLKAAEHAALLALVPHEETTHRVVQGGAWSSIDTWENGAAPTHDARVLIPTGVTVEIDGQVAARLATLRVDGTLRFATDVNTSLLVDTLVVDQGGRLEIGAPDAPIAADVTARVLFLDRGPIDSAWDPRLLSRGLISHGEVSLFGAAKTSRAETTTPPTNGALTLALATPVVGWRVGDRILIPGVNRPEDGPDGETIRDEDEILTLAAVSLDGRQITLDSPLQYDHRSPRSDLSLPLANLDRNVIFASENTIDPQRAGHVMFMHNPGVAVNYASFRFVGRNDKSVPTTDPELDATGRLVPGTGANARSRYAVHFHRTDSGSNDDGPATVTGSVVEHNPGWGFVNHDSYAVFRDNVSYDVKGAGFVAEVGSERGAMIGNLAVRSRGEAFHQVQGPTDKGDGNGFGSEGHGFWIHSPAIQLIDNVAAGHAQEGIVLHGRLVTEPGAAAPTYFPLEHVPVGAPLRYVPEASSPTLVGDGLRGDQLPLAINRGNRIFASGSGISVRWRRQEYAENPDYPGSVIEDFQIWNVRWAGIHLSYADGITLRRGVILGDMQSPLPLALGELKAVPRTAEFHASSGRGLGANRNVRLVRIEEVEIGGFSIGIEALSHGETHINAVRLSNVVDLRITTPQATVEADGARRIYASNVVHVPLSPSALAGKRHYAVQLVEQFRRDPVAGGDTGSLEWQAFTAFDTIYYNGYRLFFAAQAADAIPFASDSAHPLPVLFENVLYRPYVGQTNQKLSERWNVALGGAVAPPSAVDGASLQIDGLAAPISSLPESLLPEVVLPPEFRVDVTKNRLAWTFGQRAGDVQWQTSRLAEDVVWRVYLVRDNQAIPIGISSGPEGFADVDRLPQGANGSVGTAEEWQTWRLSWGQVGQQAIHHPDRKVEPGKYALVATVLNGPSVYLGQVTISDPPEKPLIRDNERPSLRRPIAALREPVAVRGRFAPEIPAAFVLPEAPERQTSAREKPFVCQVHPPD